jgi:hypothetical protein
VTLILLSCQRSAVPEDHPATRPHSAATMAWPGSTDFSGLQQSPTATPFSGDVPPSLQHIQQQQQQQLTPTSSSAAGPPRKRKKSEIHDDHSPQADTSGGLAKAHPVKRACNQCRQQKVRPRARLDASGYRETDSKHSYDATSRPSQSSSHADDASSTT